MLPFEFVAHSCCQRSQTDKTFSLFFLQKHEIRLLIFWLYLLLRQFSFLRPMMDFNAQLLSVNPTVLQLEEFFQNLNHAFKI